MAARDIMSSSNDSAPPPATDTRDHVLAVIRSTSEPATAAALAKLLVGPFRIKEKDLVPVLDDLTRTGRLRSFPGKTPAGKPRYWDRDPRDLARAAVLDGLRQADAPLAAKDFGKRLRLPVKLSESELAALAEEFVAAGSLHRIPATTAKGKPRYWSRSATDYARIEIRKLLDAKGPQSEVGLKKAAKGLSDVQLRQVIDEAVAARELWRYPPLGKKKGLLGSRPPAPEPYLQELGAELAQVVSQLLAASVSREDVRRALVQMIEAAGIPFASGGARAEAPAAPIDLIGLMRRLEPGADGGALVGSRELRRAARLEKTQFDRAVLELARQGRLSLHRHDFPASLSPAERDELVADGEGTYYVGMALRLRS